MKQERLFFTTNKNNKIFSIVTVAESLRASARQHHGMCWLFQHYDYTLTALSIPKCKLSQVSTVHLFLGTIPEFYLNRTEARHESLSLGSRFHPERQNKWAKRGEKKLLGKLKKENRFWKAPVSLHRATIFLSWTSFSKQDPSAVVNEPLGTDLASSPICCSSLAPWEGSMFQSTEPGTQREGGRQCSWAAATGQHQYRQSVVCLLLWPSPSTSLCQCGAYSDVCSSANNSFGYKIKQGAIWLKRKKRKHHLKIVIWHNCRVMQPRSRSPSCEGLWWWLEWLWHISEKPQLCTLWWRAVTACLPRINTLCHL